VEGVVLDPRGAANTQHRMEEEVDPVLAVAGNDGALETHGGAVGKDPIRAVFLDRIGAKLGEDSLVDSDACGAIFTERVPPH